MSPEQEHPRPSGLPPPALRQFVLRSRAALQQVGTQIMLIMRLMLMPMPMPMLMLMLISIYTLESHCPARSRGFSAKTF